MTSASGDESVKFEWAGEAAALYDRVEDELSSLGDVHVSKGGTIDISPRSSLRGTLVDVKLEGDVRRKGDTATVTVYYTCSLSSTGMVILVLGLLFFLLGLIVLIAPGMHRPKVESAVRRALRGIED